MQLYLVQDAKALPKEQAPERPLSPEGRAARDGLASGDPATLIRDELTARQ